jgi:hypothetical protein
MKRKRDIHMFEINNAIYKFITGCRLEEFEHLLKKSNDPNNPIIFTAIYETTKQRNRTTYISDEGSVGDIQKEILKIVTQHEKFNAFYPSNLNGRYALAMACALGVPEVAEMLLQLGIDPNISFKERPCGAFFVPHYIDIRCVELVLKYGLNPDTVLSLNAWTTNSITIFDYFLRYEEVECIKLLLKYGINVKRCVDSAAWDRFFHGDFSFCSSDREDIILAFMYYRQYLPIWSIKTQNRFPRKFYKKCLTMLVMFKRLNNRSNAKICPDMRKLLISYVADGWKLLDDKKMLDTLGFV